MLAHGASLRKNGFPVEQLQAILRDYHQAGLDQAEVDMMDFAFRMSSDGQPSTEADVQRLRDDGFTDEEITDIALAASVRNFYSRYFHALGAGPNPELIEQQPELWSVIKDL